MIYIAKQIQQTRNGGGLFKKQEWKFAEYAIIGVIQGYLK